VASSTNYTQNPAGLSVSDAREPLALVLDPLGNLEKRIVLPAGPLERGNEAMSVSLGDHGVAISGVQKAPGTHAAVYSDAFLVVRGWIPSSLRARVRAQPRKNVSNSCSVSSGASSGR
jgi:hypothetical protein